LPAEKCKAIEAIAMGPVIKVDLEFRSRFWDRLDGGRYADASFFRARTSRIQTIWTRLPQRSPILVAWAGGGAAQRLIDERADPIRTALEACATLFPSVDILEELRNAYYHDWQADPFSCGAYSFLRVGGTGARESLADSIAETLFFAGEATSSDDSGTVAGALASGYRAADEAIAAD
jgi:monoamine oxidase